MNGERKRRGWGATRERARRAFTLLEVLLAMALAALVLVGMNTFIFSMGELWGRGGDVRLFDRHVRSMSRFLEAELRRAALPPAVGAKDVAIGPREVRAQNGLRDDLLTFVLPEGSRLLTWPERPLPDVVCSLTWRQGEGLLLLWHSVWEERFESDAPRETVISPLVTGLAYDYYDPEFKRWETVQMLRKGATGEVEVPQRLRLTFAYGSQTRESLIAVPRVGEGLPPF